MKKEKSKNLSEKDFLISEKSCSVITLNASETFHFGKILGSSFSEGVIALFGHLGAGKTLLTKGIAEALGVKNVMREVISPSFMMIREHEAKIPFYHMDLYRIQSTNELDQINLKEYFNQKAITVIEWPELALSLLPSSRWEVYFKILGKNKRQIEVKRL